MLATFLMKINYEPALRKQLPIGDFSPNLVTLEVAKNYVST
jgi:hypothetical protein